MPPLPVIADVYRVAFKWTLSGKNQYGVNVMHFSAPGKNEQDVFDALGAHLTGAMFGDMSDQSGLQEIDILKLDGTSATVSHPLDATLTGLGSGDALVAPALMIKLVTGLRGPANRGRLFLPFPAESNTNDGMVENPSGASAAWTTFANDMVADGIALGVASYAHATWHQAITVGEEKALGTQRKRQKRVRN